MRSRSEIKLDAKAKIKGNIFKIILAVIIVVILSSIFSGIPGYFGIKTQIEETILIAGKEITTETTTPFGTLWQIVSQTFGLILNFGTATYILKLIRNENPEYSDLFAPFTGNNFVTIALVSLLTVLAITVGTICLIVPGIILAFGLSLCNYIMVDNPELKFKEVLKKSWEMMKGHKMDFFVLVLSFIGWILLCIFIIPVFYVVPYFIVTEAIFYEEVKGLNK